MHRTIALLSVLALFALSITGCETTGQTTMLGAGTGAAIAAATGESPLRGAAIGAGAGFLVGKLFKYERERDYERGYYGHEYRHYPVAERSRPGFVISPYRPHYEIDVRGFPHGARVIDPSNDRVFINP